jgi:hypothetical protein
LFADCPTEGACHSNTIIAGHPDYFCYANGTHAEYRRTGGCDGSGRVVLQVFKPDGSLCYTNEVVQGLICEGETFSWKDPSGRMIATGSRYWAGTMLQCTTGGETATCTDIAQCDLGSVWADVKCQSDGCP